MLDAKDAKVTDAILVLITGAVLIFIKQIKDLFAGPAKIEKKSAPVVKYKLPVAVK